MIKILAICGSGMGSSTIIKMKVKKFLEENKIKAEFNSCSLGESKGFLSRGIDIALCSQNFIKNLSVPEKTKLIGLRNLMDEKEFGPRILDILKESFPSEL